MTLITYSIALVVYAYCRGSGIEITGDYFRDGVLAGLLHDAVITALNNPAHPFPGAPAPHGFCPDQDGWCTHPDCAFEGPDSHAEFMRHLAGIQSEIMYAALHGGGSGVVM